MKQPFDAQYTRYQVERSALRKLVRRTYLRSARAQLKGPTLDFGCGIGELLALLPKGSHGLEYNEATVGLCRSLGLNVDWYDGYADDWRLSVIPEGSKFESMVISHVLEHFDKPMSIFSALLASAERLGIERVLVIVPGKAGFRIDDTHRTFVDLPMLGRQENVAGKGFRLAYARYFPFNLRVLGNWFPHHELQALFVR